MLDDLRAGDAGLLPRASGLASESYPAARRFNLLLRPHRMAATVDTLDLLPGRLAICRLAPAAPAPAWAEGGAFVSVTRTAAELSVVCAVDRVPSGVTSSAPWRALRVAGPIPLSDVGVLVALATPLAAAGVSIYPVATYDTDYLLVRDEQIAAAVDALRAAGCTVRE